MAVQVQKVRRIASPAAGVYAAPSDPALDGASIGSRWPRRSRFLFILGAASLCWAIPAVVVYWLALPH
jgi:hypothetical protein